MQGKGCFNVVVPTLIVAMLLLMWPLPDGLAYLRPDFVSMVLIYWALALPERVGVTVAWVVGLLLDVTHGAILGQHALGLVLVIFIVQLEYQRIRVFSLVQQALVVFVLLMIKQALVLWVSGLVGQAPPLQYYFLPSLAGALLWPWLFLLLRNLRRKFSVLKSF